MIITRDMIHAAAAANADGAGIESLSRVLGCSVRPLRSALRAAGYPGRYIGRVMHPVDARRALRRHLPVLRSAVEAARPIEPPRPVYTPLAPELGIRAHVRPDGISIPYVSSIHGGQHVS